MKDNIYEEISLWQEHGELENLKAIEAEEIKTVKPEQLGSLFQREVEKRGKSDD